MNARQAAEHAAATAHQRLKRLADASVTRSTEEVELGTIKVHKGPARVVPIKPGETINVIANGSAVSMFVTEGWVTVKRDRTYVLGVDTVKRITTLPSGSVSTVTGGTRCSEIVVKAG